MSDYTIIIDSREQQPWEFPHQLTQVHKLDTGDYSIAGLENVLCIERKKSVSEIANNITEKRFKDVLERMTKFKYSFILLEFNLEEVLRYPIGSTVPRKMWNKIKVSPNFILKNLIEFQIIYNVNVLFCGCSSNAERISLSLMNRVNEIEKSK